MSAEYFIDTNVFIYLFDETNAPKRVRAESLVRSSLQNGSGCISYQVVQETLNIITRKRGATHATARRMLEEILIPLWHINPSPTLYRRGLQVQSDLGFSLYDSLIVAAALEAGCTRLYTEDLQHGQEIGKLKIQSPFVNSS